MTQKNSRLVELDVLQDVFFPTKTDLFSTLDQSLSFHQVLYHKENSLIYETCFGVCRKYNQLDAWCDHLLDSPLKSKDCDIFLIMLIGLYQLYFLNLPDYSVINECVEMTNKINKSWAKGLVNAILRRAQRQKNEFAPFLEKEPSTKYAHETWFIDQLEKDWPLHWQEILEANNCKAPLVIRVNVLKITREAYALLLEENEIIYSLAAVSPVGIYIHEATLSKLPKFREGYFSVQDESAQMAAFLMDIKPGMHVLDACSAPGNKTCHILETYPQIALLTSVEKEVKRITKIKENLDRLELNAPNIDLINQDIVDIHQWWDNTQFDRILVDAPCSSTGVIRRHPDIKWLKNEETLLKNAKIQLGILQALWPTLKPGGKLIYSTCSIFKEENESIISLFLKNEKSAQHKEMALPKSVPLEYGYQFLPQIAGMDGFYYAMIEKII